MPFWHRIVIAAVVFGVVSLLARVIDWWLARRSLPPEAVTRYLVLRRSITAAILVVGFFSALLVIPEVRAVAGGLLASSAVIGVIIGFASQQTLGNFVAGLLIAITQPIRLGDRVSYSGTDGVVEEIGLTYTLIRALDGTRLVVPNNKLASDAIVNSTIRSRDAFAEVTVQVPLASDLATVLSAVREEIAAERDADAFVSALDVNAATITVRAATPDAVAALRLEGDLRLRVHQRLRAVGLWP